MAKFYRGRSALVVFLVSVGIRLIYLFSSPVIASNDSIDYLHGALGYLADGTLSALSTVRTPGYPLFLAVVFRLLGESGFMVVATQQLLCAALAGLVTFAAQKHVSQRFAVSAGILVAIDPITALYANCILTESVFMVLLTAGVLTFFLRELGLLSGAVTGTLLGLATLVRPNGVVAALSIVVTLLPLLLASSKRMSTIRTIIGLTLFLLVILAPWLRFQYGRTGKLVLSEGHFPFLIVQMLYYNQAFDESLITDKETVEIYRALRSERALDDEQTKALRIGFPFALRNRLSERLGQEQSRAFFEDYLTTFKATRGDQYLALIDKSLLSLLHLGFSKHWTPLTGNRYLGEVVPYDKQLASIATSPRDYRILHHPTSHSLIRSIWQRTLHIVDRLAPVGSAFLFLSIIGAIAIGLRRPLKSGGKPPSLIFLPYTVFVTQAAAYALILHGDDRYTYICNPLLIFQGVLILDIIFNGRHNTQLTSRT